MFSENIFRKYFLSEKKNIFYIKNILQKLFFCIGIKN